MAYSAQFTMGGVRLFLFDQKNNKPQTERKEENETEMMVRHSAVHPAVHRAAADNGVCGGERRRLGWNRRYKLV